MRTLAADDEQVLFWVRHTRLGVALCVVLPGIVALHTWLAPDRPHPMAVYALAAAVALSSPILLLVPVARLVRHPRGRLFFDVWEALGVGIVCALALLDDGARSPYLLFFYVLLAHAALAYAPSAMVLAGAGIIVGFLSVGLLAGNASEGFFVVGTLTLLVATATCAFASYNHVRVYRRTAAYARQIAVLAAHDGLTGCLNHRSFHDRLRAEVRGAGPDHPVALMVVDVDDFKRVNDTYGHPAGDEVLASIGRILTTVARVHDVPARLGGDEFALLLPGTSLGHAETVAQRLRHDVRTAGRGRGIGVSTGVASVTRGGAAELVEAADRALYVAKRAGGNLVTAPRGGSETAVSSACDLPVGAPARLAS